ncbi:MAG TPA: hypothetical protein VEC37_07245 [Bacillota bacterium]|nr:hypothetical protein [Bacillota bacterium]
MKKSFLVLFTLLMTLAVSVTSAKEVTNREALKEQNEMRQNITWTIEGLYKLGHSHDPKLKLTPAQARKILPVYQELINKKIVRLEGGPGRRAGAGRPEREDLSPEQAKKRIQEVTGLTQFGKTKLTEINKILTPAQMDFIDNLNFNPAQYGYVDFGKFASQDDDNSRPDLSRMREMRKKNEANRKKLYKLNQDVLEMLKKMK